MRSRLAVGFAVLASLLLVSCAGLMGPREVDIPLYKLQEALTRQFPFNNRYLDLLDISVSNPRVALQPESNRILTTMDALIAPPFLKKSWRGSFTLSGNLQFDPSRGAIVLAAPRMDSFAIDGVDPGYTRQLAKVGSLLAEQLLNDVPLYTFKSNDLRLGGTSFIPTRINAKTNGLVVTFEPAR